MQTNLRRLTVSRKRFRKTDSAVSVFEYRHAADCRARKLSKLNSLRRLANKQDKENALDELEIVDQLDVESVVNRYRCLTRVEICSALTLEKFKMDIGMKSGFR